jgi:peptidoglycan/xylan/chitin deacetylase (PgdA/CDA1 family)
MSKHRLKLFAREVYARLVFHSGLHVLVDRLSPRRLTILAGHCVTAPSNTRLPKDMKIAGEKLERLLRTLARRYEVTTIGAAWRALAQPGTRSLVALTLDDGYADNRTHLLPLLERTGVRATVYLESAPLDERTVNWTHKFFFALDALGAERFVERYRAHAAGEPGALPKDGFVSGGAATSYALKRALKYGVEPAARARVVDRVFREAGGDERALCDELYLTWDDVRELARRGVELGGHTVHHEILSRLDAEGARAEIADGRAALERGLGAPIESFAYPFGRHWDYDANSKAAARAAGFASATNTHAGTNSRTSDPYELKRLMIDEDARLHVIATEACGGFDLLRRFGVDLSE